MMTPGALNYKSQAEHLAMELKETKPKRQFLT